MKIKIKKYLFITVCIIGALHANEITQSRTTNQPLGLPAPRQLNLSEADKILRSLDQGENEKNRIRADNAAYQQQIGDTDRTKGLFTPVGFVSIDGEKVALSKMDNNHIIELREKLTYFGVKINKITHDGVYFLLNNRETFSPYIYTVKAATSSAQSQVNTSQTQMPTEVKKP